MSDTVVDSVVSLLVSLITSMSGSGTLGRSKFVTMFVFNCSFLFVMCSCVSNLRLSALLGVCLNLMVAVGGYGAYGLCISSVE